MTLLITLLSAVTVTIIWYSSEKARKLGIGILLYMFWGASLMWLVDAVAEYLESGSEFFQPSAQDMLNDSFLGLSAVALALAVWCIRLLARDRKNILKRIMKN